IEAKEVGRDRYFVVNPSRFIEYLPREMHRPKFPELFDSPKLLIQDIIGASGLIATYDDSQVYTNHSFNCCVLKHYVQHVKQRFSITQEEVDLSRKYHLHYLLGIINSSLTAFYFLTTLSGKMHASP